MSIPDYREAAAAAKLINDSDSDYLRNIFEEFSKNRADRAVNVAFNEGKDLGLPTAFKYNDDVTDYTKNCLTSLTCDLHYELDWNYRLTSVMDCADAETKDPCYGTNACFCDNGYYKVSEAMPTRPEDYAGKDLYLVQDEAAEERVNETSAGEGTTLGEDTETVTETPTKKTEAEEEEELKWWEEEDWYEDYPRWQIFSAGFIALVLLISVCCCVCKCFNCCCCKKKNYKDLKITPVSRTVYNGKKMATTNELAMKGDRKSPIAARRT